MIAFLCLFTNSSNTFQLLIGTIIDNIRSHATYLLSTKMGLSNAHTTAINTWIRTILQLRLGNFGPHSFRFWELLQKLQNLAETKNTSNLMDKNSSDIVTAIEQVRNSFLETVRYSIYLT